jgi:glycosyltransferase involved in cell wall biosynthesis
VRDRWRVSIGVPVYNGERYLGATLDSLLAQTFGDFELIICDNASTDTTGEIARSYAAKDRRVRYVRNETNLGLARNYARALELASAEYFRWHPADDLSGAESLARCIAVLDRQPAVVLAYPKTKFIDEGGRITSEYEDGLHLQAARPSERFEQLLERLGYVNALYGLMRADVVRRTRLLGRYPGSDIVFLAELSLYGTFWEIPEFLFYRRFHPAASSSMDRARLRALWDPNGHRRIYLHEWQHLLELSRAVARAPLDTMEKMRAGRVLARRALWNRDKLARELSGALRELTAARLGC